MKNLTEIFKKIVLSNVNWTVSIFYSVLEILKSNNVSLSFWDGEENWASIIVNNKVVGYVWKKHPLVVFEKESLLDIKYYLRNIDGVFYIEVLSLDKDLFEIDDDGLKEYFEDFNNFDSFTIEDLWFQTNSI